MNSNISVQKFKISRITVLLILASVVTYLITSFMLVSSNFNEVNNSFAVDNTANNVGVTDKIEITEKDNADQEDSEEAEDTEESKDEAIELAAEDSVEDRLVLGVQDQFDEPVATEEPLVVEITPETKVSQPPAENPATSEPAVETVEQPVVDTSTYYADESKVIALINNERTSRGLNALTAVSSMNASSRAWSQTIANNGYLFHADGASILASAPVGSSNYGENVAVGSTADQLHITFMNSPAHQANILKPEFTHVGVGIVVQGGSMWITERFATAR